MSCSCTSEIVKDNFVQNDKYIRNDQYIIYGQFPSQLLKVEVAEKLDLRPGNEVKIG